MARRTRAGRFDSPMPGSSMTMAPTRPKVSMKAAASAGRKEMSMRILRPSPARDAAPVTAARPRSSSRSDARGDSQHFHVQPFGHEGQRDQERDENREYLRHEGDGHFLDLRQRLKQRDGDADDQADQHDRR